MKKRNKRNETGITEKLEERTSCSINWSKTGKEVTGRTALTQRKGKSDKRDSKESARNLFLISKFPSGAWRRWNKLYLRMEQQRGPWVEPLVRDK